MGNNGRIDSSARIGIDASKKRGIGKNGINTKTIGIAHSLFTVGGEVSSCRLLRIVLSVMVTVSMISQIGDSSPMIDVLMARSEEEHQFMTGWGASITYMNDRVDVLDTS